MGSFLCADCKTPFETDGKISFREECATCSADLHVCLTCNLHDPYADNECREAIADPIAKKDRRNLCEYWKPLFQSETENLSDSTAAKAKLAALFGDANLPSPSTPQNKEDALEKLNALFKKK